MVDINFFGREFLQISIYWIVVVCFMLGFATSFILSSLREFRFQRNISQLKKEVGIKNKEIHELRTLPLRENSPAERKADGSD